MSVDGSWTLGLPCTRAEAEAAVLADLPGDPPPAVTATETDPADGEAWRIDVYLEQAPDYALIAAVRALAPSASTIPAAERLGTTDWVSLSQSGLAPIRAGRFIVHTPENAVEPDPGTVAFVIQAGRAFGTGHHETTAGCLEMLDLIARDGACFADVADIGAGTGLLAFAASALWPAARVVASDIDPVAIEVAAANMIANSIPADAIALVTADGLDHAGLAARAPYDLIVANILAGPLVALAPAIARASARGGTVVLAGLLARQADDVLGAYAKWGMSEARRVDRGDWSILGLVHDA